MRLRLEVQPPRKGRAYIKVITSEKRHTVKCERCKNHYDVWSAIGASQWSGDRLFFPLSMNATGRAHSSALWFRPCTTLCFMRSREPPQKTRTPINYALTHSDSPIIYTIVIYCFFFRFSGSGGRFCGRCTSIFFVTHFLLVFSWVLSVFYDELLRHFYLNGCTKNDVFAVFCPNKITYFTSTYLLCYIFYLQKCLYVNTRSARGYYVVTVCPSLYALLSESSIRLKVHS